MFDILTVLVLLASVLLFLVKLGETKAKNTIKEMICNMYSFFKKKRKSIENDVIVITGAAGGIGSRMAFRLANLGAKLALIDIDEINNRKLQQDLISNGFRAKAFTCDVKHMKQLENVAQLIYADPELGRCDILVCNAGVMIAKNIIDLTEDEMREVMEVNTMGYIYTVKTFYTDMISRKKGHIVCINSSSGFAGLERLSIYSTSKFALRGFFEALILEMRETGYKDLTITCVYPFIVRTNMIKDYDIISKLPLLEADETAEAIVDAILSEKLQIFVPAHTTYAFNHVKCLLPFSIQFFMAKVFSIQFLPKVKPGPSNGVIVDTETI